MKIKIDTTKKKILSLIIVGGLFFPNIVFAQWFSETRPIMGTEISVSIFLEDGTSSKKEIDAELKRNAEQVFQEMNRLNESLSPYIKSSEISQVNKNAIQKPYKIQSEIKGIIEKSLYYSELSHGAFDITFASVGYLYSYRDRIKPNEDQISQLLPGINYKHIIINDNTIYFLDPRTKIDLGGIAKGYAVDQGIKILKNNGIKIAHVSAGGDSYYLGNHIDRPWIIGIKHPRDKNKLALKMLAEDLAASTSGDYERFFLQDGERIHHIIEPKTGKPVKGVVSVTVLGKNAIDTDALSTTLFVLGIEKGLKLLEKLEGYDAIFIDATGKVYYSPGLIPAEQNKH